jgi:hypothetical protein
MRLSLTGLGGIGSIRSLVRIVTAASHASRGRITLGRRSRPKVLFRSERHDFG